MRKSGAIGRMLTGIPKNLGGDGATARVPAVAGEQPLGRLAAKSAPVATKRIEQCLTQDHVAVAVALAAMNVNHHPTTINVADLKMSRFRAVCPGAVECHQTSDTSLLLVAWCRS